MRKIVKNKYFVTTVLVVLIYIMYLKMMRIYPFGEYSILKCDLYQQYINFLCYFKQILVNGKSILICWNLGLCNSFYTTFAYYLISPLNLLVVFFDTSNMDIFVELITLMKIGLMANFTILFLDKAYSFKSKESIIFGLIYAFSSYTICYSFHIMWLDSLYMFPIVLLCVHKYVKTNRIWPVILSLSYTILTNYYIGYMVAFFTGIYYLAIYCIIDKEKKFNVFFKMLFKFIFGIIISFGIGMIVIFPSIMQLKGKMNIDFKLIEINLEKLRLIANVIFNNYVYMFTQKSCFMFSSTIILILFPLYYLNKNIKKKEKIVFTCVLVFLLLPIISPFLNRLWHCLTIPNCFNFRYSFILIFLSILMGAREFQNIKYSKKKDFVISFLIFVLLTLIEIVFNKKGYLVSDGYSVTMFSIYLSCIVYILMFVLLFIIYILKLKEKTIDEEIKKEKQNRFDFITFILLVLMIIADLLISARSGQNNNDKYFKRDVVLQYDNFMSYFIPKINSPETERIVFLPDSYGSNMSLKYGYSNIGFFTSARNRENLKAMYKLGYNVQMDEQLWITSYSGTFLNYCLAGVKYYITKEPIENNEIYGFTFLEKYDDLYIYENKYNFNIGYYLSKDIEESYNPFKMQNEILENLYTKEENETKNEEEKYFQSIENTNVLNTTKQIEFDNETEEYMVKYSIKTKKDCNIYIASDYDLQIYINNEPLFKKYSNIWSIETGIKQIKYLKENEEFEFILKTKNNLEMIYIYVSDNEKIQSVLDKKDKNEFKNIEIKKDGLSGSANFKNDGYLVFSISYDDNWKIFVSGKERKKEKILGCFLGVKLEKGEYDIALKY